MRRLASLSLFVASFVPASMIALEASAQCSPSSPIGWHYDPAGTQPGCASMNTVGSGVIGFGTHVLSRNDDSWDGPVDLTPAFPGGLNFYGGPYTTMYVNTNGNITFNAGLFTFTPAGFPLPFTAGADRSPMIAAYWADVDTRTPVVDGGPVAANHDLVYYDLQLGQVTITWYDVGYYNSHYQNRMTFQMILRNATGGCGMGDFDVEFRYNTCEWVAGTASGSTAEGTCESATCTPANVGFDANDGPAATDNFVTIPESLTNEVVNVCVRSNVGEPGVYRWSVRGGALVCAGGGTPCEVPGMTGACGIGVNVCHADGVRCEPIGTAGVERCDNIDNDCNGTVDDGSNLCPDSQVCVNGTCIGGCLDGGCNPGFQCDPSGACIETACVGVTCPANQRCVGGSCVDSCTGVVCPHEQQCAAGRCVDLCAVLTCDSGQVCDNGMCIPTCPCTPCAADEQCDADGRCTATNGCDIVNCAVGQYCRNGECLDACAGAICPANQHCELGNCIDNGAIGVDSGVPPIDASIPFNDANIGDFDAGPGADGGRGGPGRPKGGCGCRIEENSSSALAPWLALGVIGLVVARRRRVRR